MKKEKEFLEEFYDGAQINQNDLLVDISHLTKPEIDYMKYLEDKRNKYRGVKKGPIIITDTIGRLRSSRMASSMLPKPEELEHANC